MEVEYLGVHKFSLWQGGLSQGSLFANADWVAAGLLCLILIPTLAELQFPHSEIPEECMGQK